MNWRRKGNRTGADQYIKKKVTQWNAEKRVLGHVTFKQFIFVLKCCDPISQKNQTETFGGISLNCIYLFRRSREGVFVNFLYLFVFGDGWLQTDDSHR